MNPLVPNSGMADPHIYVFEGRVYLYTGRDADPTLQRFLMPDWNVWSSADLISWRHETTISPNITYIGASAEPECWATSVAYRGGSYFFFFSNGGNGRAHNFGVMRASSPTLVDAVDALGRPLVSEPGDGGVTQTNLTRAAYDPTVFIDDNETPYVCFGVLEWDGTTAGTKSQYLIAKLDETFLALAEEPRPLHFLPRPDGAFMPSNDKSTLHKRDGLYYLSAGSMYATLASVYGPYTFRGDTNPHDGADRSFGLNTRGHGRFWSWRNQWFHVWCEFVSLNSSGVSPYPPDSKSFPRYRDSWMTYTH